MTTLHAVAVGSPVEDAGLHAHVCLVYDNESQQFRSVVPFFRSGLAKGERCVYIADDLSRADVIRALYRGGIDAEEEIQRGALLLVGKDDAYLRGGRFDPDEMFAFLDAAIADALKSGFTALRASAEMTWALNAPGGERVLEYEARVNDFLRDRAMSAVCQYNRARFDPVFIKEVILTHPYVVYEGRLCANTYYLPPDEYLDPNRPAREVDRILQNILHHQEELEALLRQGEAKDEFIGFISHELKAPMTVILGLASTLANRSHELSEADRRKALLEVRQETHHLARMLDDLLTLASVGHGEGMEMAPVALEACINGCVREFSRAHLRREVRVQVEDASLQAFGYEGYISLAVSNLLNNADKYSPPGVPIDIQIAHGPPGFVRVSIRDHGPGIRPEDMERLFQPFFRGQRESGTPGAGLGLTVCQRLIEAQGGRIWAENHAEGGALFMLELPEPAAWMP